MLTDQTSEAIQELDHDSPWREVVAVFWRACRDNGALWSVFAAAAITFKWASEIADDITTRLEKRTPPHRS